MKPPVLSRAAHSATAVPTLSHSVRGTQLMAVWPLHPHSSCNCTGSVRQIEETNAAPEFAQRTRGIRAQRELPCLGITDLYCPTRTAARGDQLRPQVPPCGAHWPLHLCSSHLFSGSDSSAAVISRNSQRLRLSNRQLKRCNSRQRELPRSKFANYMARVAVSGSQRASSRS